MFYGDVDFNPTGKGKADQASSHCSVLQLTVFKDLK